MRTDLSCIFLPFSFVASSVCLLSVFNICYSEDCIIYADSNSQLNRCNQSNRSIKPFANDFCMNIQKFQVDTHRIYFHFANYLLCCSIFFGKFGKQITLTIIHTVDHLILNEHMRKICLSDVIIFYTDTPLEIFKQCRLINRLYV